MQGILYNSNLFNIDHRFQSHLLIYITIQFDWDLKLIILQHVYVAWFLQYWDREFGHSFGDSRTVQI